MGLEGALHGDVGGASAHQTDEVVVLLGGEGVGADVADDLGVDLGGGIVAEGDGDVLVLEIAIDGLGAADDLGLEVVGGEVLGEEGGVGVGVVATDDDEAVEAELGAGLSGGSELLFLLDLVTAGADHIEATHVSVLVHVLGGDLDVVVGEDALWSAAEAVALAADLLGEVEDTGDDVVASGSLAAGEDDTDADGVVALLSDLLELDAGEAVGLGEEGLDLLWGGQSRRREIP